MKRIHRKISLENYRSRYCGLLDSFEGNNYVAFRWEPMSEEDAQEIPHKNVLEVLWPQDIETNYSLFPCDIKIEEKNKEEKVYSYPTIRDTYYQMLDYKDYLLAKESNFFTPRLSDMDGDYLNQRYDNLGGDNVFDVLSSTIFPSFELPASSVTDWGKYRLNIAEAMQWLGYFKLCEAKLASENVEDCCECEKYEKLHGKDLIQPINDWIEYLSSTTKVNSTHSAFTNVRISLTTPIDDMGELTPLTEEWNGLDQYKKNSVVSHNGEVYISLESSETVYDCREIIFPLDCDDEDLNKTWETYSKHIKNKLPTCYNNSNITSYTYINNQLVINPNWNNTITYTIPLMANGGDGFYYISNQIYMPFKASSITEDDTEYFLNDEDGTNAWFEKKDVYGRKCVIRGTITTSGTFAYTITDGECPSLIESAINVSAIVNYMGQYVKPTNGGILEIKDGKEIYHSIHSYGYDKQDKLVFVNKNRKIVEPLLDVELTNVGDNVSRVYQWSWVERKDIYPKGTRRDWDKTYYSIDAKENLCHLYEPLKVYNAKIITSQTESKLSLFRQPLATDGLGNELNGVYLPSSQGNELGLPYSSGTTASNVVSEDNEMYWVDYLSSITLSVMDNVSHKEIESKNYDPTSSITEQVGNIEDGQSLKCKFLYFMGCEVEIGKNNLVTLKNSGITYEETYTLKKSQQIYHYNDYSSGTITYYEMINDAMTYGEYNKALPLATIKYAPQMWKENTFSNKFEFVSSPLMRQEYLLGIASKENVTGDIYIDRGMSQAYDKHLKLMEVNSLEALENYSNGYFKIQ